MEPEIDKVWAPPPMPVTEMEAAVKKHLCMTGPAEQILHAAYTLIDQFLGWFNHPKIETTMYNLGEQAQHGTLTHRANHMIRAFQTVAEYPINRPPVVALALRISHEAIEDWGTSFEPSLLNEAVRKQLVEGAKDEVTRWKIRNKDAGVPFRGNFGETRDGVLIGFAPYAPGEEYVYYPCAKHGLTDMDGEFAPRIDRCRLETLHYEWDRDYGAGGTGRVVVRGEQWVGGLNTVPLKDCYSTHALAEAHLLALFEKQQKAGKDLLPGQRSITDTVRDESEWSSDEDPEDQNAS